MKKTALELRELVIDNSLTLGRLDAKALGSKDDYKDLTERYQIALDAITDWAAADYNHKTVDDDINAAFAAVKDILNVFATNESRIIIDASSMNSLRDCATKPKRFFSKAFRDAEKARKNAVKTLDERYADLMTLGAPTRNEDEDINDYATRVRETGVNVTIDKIDMLDMYLAASATLTVKTKAVDDIKAAGDWTWRRPYPVELGVFADLVENYIADCLIDGRNIKTSKVIREEKAEERAKKAEEKKNA